LTFATTESKAPQNLLPLVPTNGVAFFAYLLFLFLVIRPVLLLGDGGTCRHAMTGEYILKHHVIPTTNYVFAIDPNSPWLTHELLTDLILGAAQNLLGLNGIVLIAAMAISLVLTWSYQFARLRGLGTISGLLLLIIVMAATSIHWSARAHVFSYVPFMIVYFILFVADLQPRIRYSLLGLTMCIWANLHGSFVIGLMMILAKLLVVTASLLFRAAYSTTHKEQLKSCLLDLVCAIAGASINIRGLNFLQYVAAYASNPLIALHSQESRSIDFSVGLPVYAFLLLFLFVVMVWIYSKSPPDFSEFLVTLALFFGSLYAMRLVPYFALISLPVMGKSWLNLRRLTLELGAPASLPAFHSESKHFEPIASFLATEERVDAQESTRFRSHVFTYAICLVGVVVWTVVPYFKINDYDPERLPVDAATWLIKQDIQGLGFNPDNWGDYLYWRRQKPVFIDDKGDFYSPDFVDKYSEIYTGSVGWRKVADQYKLNWLLLPNALPLVPILSHDPEWKGVYQDKLVILFLRTKPI